MREVKMRIGGDENEDRKMEGMTVGENEDRRMEGMRGGENEDIRIEV